MGQASQGERDWKVGKGFGSDGAGKVIGGQK